MGEGHRSCPLPKRPSDLPAVCLLGVLSRKGNTEDSCACVWDTHNTVITQIRLVWRGAQYKCVSVGVDKQLSEGGEDTHRRPS